MMTNEEIAIVHFCARECKLQMSGELSVGWMVDAWVYAQGASREFTWEDYAGRSRSQDKRPTVLDVLTIGRLCEPWDNRDGFRTQGVRIGQDIKMNQRDIPRQIENLIQHGSDLTPAEFFREYEEIHPFIDGNGRSGLILFNWINQSLSTPTWAPDFWGDPRRTIGNGAS